jgi:hypothetical protein
LATITSESEWNTIQFLIGDQMKTALFWLGASDHQTEGLWKWVTGEPWGYTRWASSSEPSGTGGAGPENFLLTWGSNYWFWNDGPGGDQRGYILERGFPTDPNKADTDGDGFLDGEESRLGSNPLDPASQPVPVISIFPAVEIEFQSEPEKRYQIQTSTNLTSWSNSGGLISGTGGRLSQFLQSREKGPKFYRIQRVP